MYYTFDFLSFKGHFFFPSLCFCWDRNYFYHVQDDSLSIAFLSSLCVTLQLSR